MKGCRELHGTMLGCGGRIVQTLPPHPSTPKNKETRSFKVRLKRGVNAGVVVHRVAGPDVEGRRCGVLDVDRPGVALGPGATAEVPWALKLCVLSLSLVLLLLLYITIIIITTSYYRYDNYYSLLL